MIFLNSASSAVAPVFDLPLCAVYKHRGETERGQSPENILKSLKKTQYLMNTLYYIPKWAFWATTRRNGWWFSIDSSYNNLAKARQGLSDRGCHEYVEKRIQSEDGESERERESSIGTSIQVWNLKNIYINIHIFKRASFRIVNH